VAVEKKIACGTGVPPVNQDDRQDAGPHKQDALKLSTGPEAYRPVLTFVISEVHGDPLPQKWRSLEAVILVYAHHYKLIIGVTERHAFPVYPLKSAGELPSRADLRQDQKSSAQHHPEPTTPHLFLHFELNSPAEFSLREAPGKIQS